MVRFRAGFFAVRRFAGARFVVRLRVARRFVPVALRRVVVFLRAVLLRALLFRLRTAMAMVRSNVLRFADWRIAE